MIGLIAEDATDRDALRNIVHRVLGEKTQTKSWAAGGCGFLKRKLSAQLKQLSKQGCSAFVILHDLDRNPQNKSLNNEAELRTTLSALAAVVSNHHICIPIEELEAWFWSDPAVVEYVGQGKG